MDTGPWIFGRKVVISAGAIERVDVENRVVHVAMTKDETKRSPVFDPERGWDDDYRRQFDTYFGGLRDNRDVEERAAKIANSPGASRRGGKKAVAKRKKKS